MASSWFHSNGLRSNHMSRNLVNVPKICMKIWAEFSAEHGYADELKALENLKYVHSRIERADRRAPGPRSDSQKKSLRELREQGRKILSLQEAFRGVLEESTDLFVIMSSWKKSWVNNELTGPIKFSTMPH